MKEVYDTPPKSYKSYTGANAVTVKLYQQGPQAAVFDPPAAQILAARSHLRRNETP